MAIEIEKLTLGEVATVENLSGLSVGQLGEDIAPKGKLLAALAYVAKRREQLAAGDKPSFTWNDALALEINEAYDLLGLGDDEPDDDAEVDDPKAD